MTATPTDESVPTPGMLQWALRELLGSLPARRDWLNPDAEKVLQAALTAETSATHRASAELVRTQQALRDLAEYAAREIGVPLEECTAGPIGRARAVLPRVEGQPGLRTLYVAKVLLPKLDPEIVEGVGVCLLKNPGEGRVPIYLPVG